MRPLLPYKVREQCTRPRLASTGGPAGVKSVCRKAVISVPAPWYNTLRVECCLSSPRRRARPVRQRWSRSPFFMSYWGAGSRGPGARHDFRQIPHFRCRYCVCSPVAFHCSGPLASALEKPGLFWSTSRSEPWTLIERRGGIVLLKGTIRVWAIRFMSGSWRCEAMPSTAQAPWFSDYDLYLRGESTHYRAYQKMGSHLGEVSGQPGVHFAVWARNAKQVTVLGDFNGWNL